MSEDLQQIATGSVESDEMAVLEGEERLDLVINDFKLSRKELLEIKKLGELVKPELPRILDDFYQWLSAKPYYKEFFPDQEVIPQVKARQLSYWEALFGGKVDEKYIESRQKVAEVHVAVSLPMEYFLSGMQFFYDSVCALLDDEGEKTNNSKTKLLTFSKFMYLDMALVANTFNTAFAQREIAQNRAAWEMSAPVARVWEGVLLLSLTGYLDSQRTLEVTAKILEAISETQSEIFILDISGVAVVDSAVANHLIRVSRATHLMGCESVISGVSPEIAQSIVNLGIDVGSMQTTTTLKKALEIAFEHLGYTISTN